MATAKTSSPDVTDDVATSVPVVDVPYVEVYDEPSHPTAFNNDYVRIIKVDCAAHQETIFHRHAQDSFFIFFEPAKVLNEHMGKEPFDMELDAGAFYWGDHLINPMIHRVRVGNRALNCMDIELKADRPKAEIPFLPLVDTASRELCLENEVMRAYRVTVAPGEDVYSVLAAEERVAVGSPYLVVVMRDVVMRGANKVEEGGGVTAGGMKDDKEDGKKLTEGGLVKAGTTFWRDGTCGGGGEDKFACEDGVELMIVQPK